MQPSLDSEISRLKELFERVQAEFASAVADVGKIPELIDVARQREHIERSARGTPQEGDPGCLIEARAAIPQNQRISQIWVTMRRLRSEVLSAIEECRRTLAPLSTKSTTAGDALNALEHFSTVRTIQIERIADREILRDLGGLIRLIDSVSSKPQESRSTAPGVSRLKNRDIIERVQQLAKAGYDHEQICGHLANSARPANVAWKDYSWPEAFKKKHGSVTKWISVAKAKKL